MSKVNFERLQELLDRQMHGQHIVKNNLVSIIAAHYTSVNPSKALSLSFHGPTGTGKNLVAELISKSLYDYGVKSKYVHLMSSAYHYSNRRLVEVYKEELRKLVTSSVAACERSIFIFDEIDRMPNELLDTLMPFLDHYNGIDGLDYRKTMFIFLSNTGTTQIIQKTHQQWSESKPREDLTYKEMERLISLSAYNDEVGGLFKSKLIEKHMITAFFPFLPLDISHIRLCIRDTFDRINDSRNKAKSKTPIPDDVRDSVVMLIAEDSSYYMVNEDLSQKYGIFVTSGCKRIAEKVATHIYKYHL